MFRCFFNTIDSTNKQAKDIIRNEDKIPEIFSVFSNNQTDGKGKLGSNWQSLEGNLYLSIVLKIGKYFSLKDLGLISILTSVSLKDTLNYFIDKNYQENSVEENISKNTIVSNFKVFCKWPNDIIIKNINNVTSSLSNDFNKGILGAKISGILLEIEQNKAGEDYLVVGVGVNLANAPKLNNYSTISLFDITSKKIINLFFADIFESKFYYYLNTFKSNKISILEDFKKNLYLYKKEVKIKVGDTIKQGELFDITEEGYLILKTGTNKEIITAGDVFGFSTSLY